MALSRKYYKMIAKCIKDNSEVVKDISVDVDGINSIMINKDSLIDDMSNELKRDNINFNYTMFKDACQ